jgi:hypothetical protein
MFARALGKWHCHVLTLYIHPSACPMAPKRSDCALLTTDGYTVPWLFHHRIGCQPWPTRTGSQWQQSRHPRRPLQSHLDSSGGHRVRRLPYHRTTRCCQLVAGAASGGAHQPVEGRVQEPGAGCTVKNILHSSMVLPVWVWSHSSMVLPVWVWSPSTVTTTNTTRRNYRDRCCCTCVALPAERGPDH